MMTCRKRVAIVKLKAKPNATPRGLNLPFCAPTAKRAGRTGKIHGDNIVTPPAKKEKR
jgi:hypothetical protein